MKLALPKIDRGPITSVNLNVSDTVTDPTSFTLIGKTSGGPPTNYTWMRNGEELTGNSSFQISLSLKEVSNKYRDSVYQSRLTVTGTHLGVYTYSVFNRAMQDWRNSSIFIGGMVKRQLGFISGGVVLINASNYNYRGPNTLYLCA
jgi:hypothetical protein